MNQSRLGAKPMKIDKQEFYIRDSRSDVGTSAMFWSSPGGYTSDLNKAQAFTRDDAISQHMCRETDIPVLISIAREYSYLAVDMQYLPDTGISDLNYLVIKNKYDGNNVLFTERGCNSFGLDSFRPVTAEKAKNSMELNKGIDCYPADKIEAIARPVVNSVYLQTRTVLRRAKIKMNPRLLAKNQSTATGKERGNCPECGKIVWDFNPYSDFRCRWHQI